MNKRTSLTTAAAILAAIFLVSTNRSQALPPGLVSWWQAENNTLDNQGVNNGTAQGMVNYAPGAVGQGFSLADSGYIDVASPTLNSFNSAFTIAGWFLIANVTGGQPSLLNFRNTSNNSGFSLEQNNAGNLIFNVAKTGGGGSFTSLSSSGWVPNTPYYIAATFDGATMDIYRNGSLVSTRTDAADTVATVSSPMLQIGRNIVNTTLWDGKIDEVQFYSRALSQPEVASLVPEPASLALLVGGAALFLGARRRKPMA